VKANFVDQASEENIKDTVCSKPQFIDASQCHAIHVPQQWHKEVVTMTSLLSHEQRLQLEQLLSERAQQLRTRLSDHHEGLSRVEHAREVLQQDGDDAPQRSSDREVDLAITDLETVELSKVNAALARIARPDYGVCVSCDAHIAYERLQIEPTTQRCVACKSKAE
jgi:DnaK suppressor protein